MSLVLSCGRGGCALTGVGVRGGAGVCVCVCVCVGQECVYFAGVCENKHYNMQEKQASE